MNPGNAPLVGPPVPPTGNPNWGSAYDPVNAMLDELVRSLQTQGTQATGDANSANQAYQAALSAPGPAAQSPTTNPLAALASLAANNMGAVLTRNPASANDAAKSLQDQADQRYQMLVQKRTEGLNNLHDLYLEKAKRAADIGNLGLELQFKEKAAGAMAKAAALAEGQRTEFTQAAETSRANARNATDIQIEAMKARAAKAAQAGVENDVFSNQVYETAGGNKFLDMAQFTDAKTRNQALTYAKNNNLTPMPAAGSERLRTAQEVYKDMDGMAEVLRGHLSPDTNWMKRLAKGGANTLGAFFQTNKDLGSFRTFKDVAIRHIQSLAGGTGSGFRLTQSEVDQAISMMPSLTDNLPTAMQALANMRTYLQNKESTFFNRKWSTGMQAGGGLPGIPTSMPNLNTTVNSSATDSGRNVPSDPANLFGK